MTFHVTFTYDASSRDHLLNFLKAGGLRTDGSIKIVGAWVALETGVAFAIVKSDNAKSIYEMCSAWTEYGEITVTPVLAASDL